MQRLNSLAGWALDLSCRGHISVPLLGWPYTAGATTLHPIAFGVCVGVSFMTRALWVCMDFWMRIHVRRVAPMALVLDVSLELCRCNARSALVPRKTMRRKLLVLT